MHRNALIRRLPIEGANQAPDLRLLIDSTPGLIHTSLPDGYLDFFNQTWLNYVGRSLEDLQGWKWTECIHPDDVEGVVQKWRASLASGEPFVHEARVRRADGEYRWMLHHKVALRDEHGEIVRWFGSSIDIEDRKRAEEELRAAISERARLAALRAEIGMALARKDNLKGILDLCAKALVRHLDATFARIWTLSSDGRELELQASAGIYTRLDGRYGRIPFGKFKIGAIAQTRKPHVTNDVQNDPRIQDHEWASAEKMTSFAGYPLVVEGRVVGVMGMFSRKALNQGTIDTLSFIADGIAQSIERKHAEEALQVSEFYLAEGERIAQTGSWALNPSGFFEHWSRELFRIYGLDPRKGAPTVEQYLATVHPQDRDFIAETVKRMCEHGSGCDAKQRIIRPDGAVRYIRCVGVPVLENGVLKRLLGTAMDVTEQEELTQELQRREAYLAEAQGLSHTGSFGWKPESGEIVWSEETYRIFEYDRTLKPTIDSIVQRVHPEDRADFQKVINSAFSGAAHFEHTYRLLLPDGSVKHIHALAHALQDASGIREFVGAAIDVTERNRADERIRQDERELRQLINSLPQHVFVLDTDGRLLQINQMALDYTGRTLQEMQGIGSDERLKRDAHPDDLATVRATVQKGLSSRTAFDVVRRTLGTNGRYRWFLYRYKPILDETGRLVRWFLTATDIEDRKREEEGVRKENIALREEVSKASMFEEIVGASPVLQTVLSRISKVAPTVSTVLITGETGTGKELVARAVHRRSQRSSRPFVSVNCVAIPRDLIASELFGHEKGAFTGALQRRLGKFELAEGGTIFLDEIGELPAETQIVLLRVLQEHEFERVGGNQAIRTDVRVVAATNGDLQAAIAAGTFRSDLFYRLNVFPIEVPPLRARKEDLAMLVGYFIERFARQAGKQIKNIDRKTLELIQAYPWPGNVRELQNVIERSVILCETDILSVDESWLSPTSPAPQTASPRLSKKPLIQEKDMIEAALAETRGRVSGRAGAAAKLGIPPTTLDSKIKSLKINKHHFKAS